MNALKSILHCVAMLIKYSKTSLIHVNLGDFIIIVNARTFNECTFIGHLYKAIKFSLTDQTTMLKGSF